MDTLLFLGFIALLHVAGFVWWQWNSARQRARATADARAEALRWYERLGGQVMNLHGDTPAVRQALLDAGERYNAAGSQLEQARTVRQYEIARETALEGLAHVQTARTALGLDAHRPAHPPAPEW